MDPELKRLLEENLAVAKDNNGILRSLRHHQWLSSFFSFAFWIALIIVPLFFYQKYFQPIFTKLYGNSGTSGPFGLPTSADLQKLIDSYKAGQTTR